MKPKIFLSCLILLSGFACCYGQSEYFGNLKSELSNCTTAVDSVNILNQLAWDLAASDKKESIKYGFLAYEKIKSINDSLLISDIYDAAAIGFRFDGQYQLAEKLYKLAIGIGERYKNLNRISWSNYNLATLYFEMGRTEDAILFTEEAIRYFKKDKNTTKILDSYRMLIDNKQVEYAEPLADALIENLDYVSDEGEKMFIYLDLTNLYNKLEDKNKAMHYVQLAMDVADKNKNVKGIIKAYLQIADYFSNTQCNYEMALVYLEKALEYNLEANIYSFGDLYLQIGDNHMLLGHDSLALGYFQKALEYGQIKDHRHSRASAYMKLGEINYQQHHFDKALDFYLKCYETGCDVCPQITFHDALINIGNVYLFSDDLTNAEKYFQMGLELADTSLASRPMVKSYQSFSDLYEKKGDLNKAIGFSQTAFNLSRNTSFLEGQRFNASRLSELYQKQNNFREAIRYINLTNILSDSIQKISHADNLAKLETYFDFQNLQMKNGLDQARSEKEITRQKLYRNFFIFGFILLGITGFIVFMAYRRKRKDNVLLNEQKLAIETMSKKVHDADQAKLDFYTNVSHEFKTPLTLILGMTEKLKSLVNENQYIGSIRKNSFKLLQLVNHLLDLRKIDAHKMRLFVREGNIKEFIKGIISSFEDVAFQKGIKVDFLSTDEEIVGYFDHDKLEKIISNLLSNAIKYNHENGLVKVSLIKHNDGFVEIDMNDNGIGIPEDALKNVFERFYRVSENTDHGSGIGLALVKEFVELHKGEINVISKVGKGTSFTFKIPVDRNYYAENEISFEEIEDEKWDYTEIIDRQAEVKEEFRKIPETDKKTILVVEDNHDLRQFICEIFKIEYSVLEARDGEEGFEKSKECIPDIVISDIMMPKLTGLQMIDKIKNDITTSHIPVILLTAKNDLGTQLSGYEKGADDYISKPFDSELLKSRVENLLRLRSQLVEKFSKQFHLQPREITIEDADRKFLQKTIDLIEENISNPDLCVDLLALKLNVSRTQLYRKLKALTDYSANQFIRIIRLKRAAQILRQGQNNIAEVMDATGFSNYSYFNNCFKEYFGEYPKEYALLSLKGSSN
ncbi:MAG: tetratricopeptide repeat protein [Prolixibacteraceae bacterium]|nr:tetratricopeptide repeat protein [Prolixibacteraceae bacterium]